MFAFEREGEIINTPSGRTDFVRQNNIHGRALGRLPELRLGDQVLHRVPVVILPDELIANSSGSAAIGFIAGVRTVLDYQVQVDMPGQRMTLVRERRNCKTQLAAGRKGHAYSMWLAEARDSA